MNFRTAVLPCFVFLCALLGGSSRDVWPNAILQVLAVLLIGYALMSREDDVLPATSKTLVALAAAALTVIVLQLVPLPPGLWSSFPGRERLWSSYELLGQTPPWLPLSLAPYATIDVLTWSLPGLGALLAALLVKPPAMRACAFAILLAALAGIVLGAVQVSSGQRWYLYEITNNGAVGFFANRNFMGTLLLVSIPFTVALLADRTGKSNADWTLRIVASASLVLIVTGLALNRSLAALLLAAPVAIASAALLPNSARIIRYALPLAAVASLVGISFVTNSPVGSELSGADTTSVTSRVGMWGYTLQAIRDHFPIGTGVGSFAQIFATYEDPDLVSRTFVNHAHNDYLELVLETGALGIVLIAVFLGWWTVRTVKIWRSVEHPMIPAATIASGAILLHSVVDYPLRTAAIAAIFGLCLGVMARGTERGEFRPNPSVRPPRHVRIA